MATTKLGSINNWIKRNNDLSIVLLILVSFIVSRIVMFGVYLHSFGEAPTFIDWLHRINTFDVTWYTQYVYSILGRETFIDYGTGQTIWAFFPLDPLIIAFFMKISAMKADIALVAFIVNSSFFMLSEFVAYKYIMLTRKSYSSAVIYILLMTFGPYSFYFSIFYTESLFILLLTLCYYFLKKKKYLLMGVCGALLSATRNVGIMFVFVILADCIVEYISEKKIKKNFGDFVKTYVLKENLILGTALVPMGLFSYIAFLTYKVGDGFAFLHVQTAWARGDNALFWAAKHGIISVFPAEFLGVMLVISLSIIAYAIFHNRRVVEMVLPVIILLLSATTILQSVPRYMVGCFTVMLAVTDIYKNMSKTAKVILTIVLLAFEIILIREWDSHNAMLC